MFDGVPQDQLHHLIASSRTTSNIPSSSLPLSSFSLHHYSQITTNTNIISNNNNNSFDSFPNQLLFPLHQHHEFLHHPILQHNKSSIANGSLGCQAGNKVQAVAAETGEDRDLMAEPPGTDSWTDDEVLALLRIRSSMENWFPDFTWEHVSRKLAELGFKIRSAEKCKEKFEEESRYFNNNNNCTKNNLLFRPFLTGELEELCNNNNNHQTQPNTPDHHHHTIVEPQKTENDNPSDEIKVSKKRKRRSCSGKSSDDKFEALKGFCEEVVNKLMARQEEMHGKLIEDMVRRDRDKAEKEEALKRTEFERLDRELDHMARDQALAVDRHSSIVELLTKLATKKNKHHDDVIVNSSSSSPLLMIRESPSDDPAPNDKAFGVVRRNPSPNPNGSLDCGKRWPRDEVLALINLRCSLYNNNNNDGDSNNRQETESSVGSKAVPLWERISQGMSEMGYKRSAKRCKEKWENINKYFRKTKDANKKRSVDSRTCPYFEQLSALYNKGRLVNHHHHNNHDDEDYDHLNHSLEDVHVVGDHRGERSETTTTTIANNTNNNGNNNSIVVVPSAFDFEF